MPLPHINLLLEALSSHDKAGLSSQLEAVPMPVGTVLFNTGILPRHAHFMTFGIGSVVSMMAGGNAVEVAW